jgi:hypothetical protein
MSTRRPYEAFGGLRLESLAGIRGKDVTGC